AAHIFPQRYTEVYEAARAQRRGRARAGFHRLWPQIQLLFAEPHPAGLKAALAQQGLIEDVNRAPMHGASPALRAQLTAMLQAMERDTGAVPA
ncbi:MAG: dihydrodipicolinate synthase family protein, partial [Nevskiales bacterium]